MAKKKSSSESSVDPSVDRSVDRSVESSVKPASGKRVPAKRSGSPPASPPAPSSPPDGLPPISKLQGFKAVTIDRRRIKNAEYNPRTISPAARRKLRKSLERFKLVESLVWNVRTGNLVGGHQRLGQIDALEETDAYSLTVSQIDVDEKTEQAINIALNNPEAQGQYDISMLADVISNIRDTSPALVQDAGFDVANLSMLFGDEFLLPHERAQSSADAPVVSDLNAMYEAGAAAQRSAKQRGPASDPAGEGDEGEGGEGVESPDGQEGDAEGGEDGQDNADGQQYGKAGWTKQDFKDRRREYASQRSLVDEANAFLVLVFDSSSQIGDLLESLGFNPNLTKVDAGSFLGTLGVELAQVSGGGSENADGESEG